MQIKDLPSTSTVNSTDLLVKEQSDGTTEKIAISDFVVDNLSRDATKVPSAQCVYNAIASYDELYDFSGTSSQTVNLDGTASNYCFLTFIVYDSGGQIVNAVTAPPVYFRNLTVKYMEKQIPHGGA